MLVKIYIDGQQLELFEQEDIQITSSVLDVQDLTKNTTDYSKSFTVPASNVNNRIFKHYYNADIDNSFDARIAVTARIEIGGFIFRKGKIILRKVIVKKGVASSYEINFFGDLIDIKDLLGSDKLGDLDLSAYNHPFNGSNVLSKLTDQSDFPTMIYTLLAKKQYYYSSDPADKTMLDNLVNICYQAGSLNGIIFDDLTPAISLTTLIEEIESQYGLTFSRDFFGLPEFKGLYLWLNNKESEKLGGSTKTVNFTTGDQTNINLSTDLGSFETTTTKSWLIRTKIFPDADYSDEIYTLKVYIDGDLAGSVTAAGTKTLTTPLNYSLNGVGFSELRWELETTSAFEYSVDCRQEEFSGGTRINIYDTSGTDTVISVFDVALRCPDIKILDFFKGLVNAFKLVVIPKEDGTIYVNTVDSYYAGGEIFDITPYVDNDQIDIERGEIKNEISFTFQDPQTILNAQFNANNGKGFGDEIAELRDDQGKLLDGDSMDIQLPFEQIIYERLNDLEDADDIELMYGAVINDKLEGVNPKPHIFYRQMYRVGGKGIGLIDENGNKTQIRGFINTASHVIDDADPSHSFIFSQEFNEFTGALITNTLYSNYHQSYIESIFNIKRRNFKYKCKMLPIHILLKLSLDDKIKIGYSYFRIDSFTTGLISGSTEFNLINI